MDVWRERWDDRKKEPIDKPLLIRLNQKILDLDLYINRILADGQLLNIELVRSYIGGKRQVRPEAASFYGYYMDFVERKRKEGIREGTISGYLNTLGILRGFRSELAISEMSLRFIEDFDQYLCEVKGNALGGRGPKHRNLRAVILDIQKHNIPVDNPYRFFRLPAAEAKEVYLDRGELAQLAAHCDTLQPDSTALRVLQMYLFSCYCGLRLSDALDLRWGHIDWANGLIRKVMVKTNHEVITPLFPLAKDILLLRSNGRDMSDDSGRVFHSYSEPVFNKTLRKQAKLAGITKHLTYHLARHRESFNYVCSSVLQS